MNSFYDVHKTIAGSHQDVEQLLEEIQQTPLASPLLGSSRPHLPTQSCAAMVEGGQQENMNQSREMDHAQVSSTSNSESEPSDIHAHRPDSSTPSARAVTAVGAVAETTVDTSRGTAVGRRDYKVKGAHKSSFETVSVFWS